MTKEQTKEALSVLAMFDDWIEKIWKFVATETEEERPEAVMMQKDWCTWHSGVTELKRWEGVNTSGMPEIEILRLGAYG